MDEKEKRELLKSEYLHLQSVIEDFDQRALTVKTWSISFSFAALGGAFAANAPIVLLVASVSALIFWFLEGQWKTFQYAYYSRSETIEEFFAGKIQDLAPMQIGTSWRSDWNEGGIKRLLWIIRWPHVAMPHIAVFVIGLIVYVCVVKGLIQI